MSRLASLSLLLMIADALSACAPRAVIELGALRIDPELVVPGGVLEVSGADFSSVVRCSIALRGTTARPGDEPLAVDVTADARFDRRSQLIIACGERLCGALGLQGTFDGTFWVDCMRNDGRSAQSKPQPIRFDLQAPLARGTERDRALDEEARAALVHVGIEPAENQSTALGVVVGTVRPFSAAARAGLHAGDRVIEAGGVRVHAVRDLAPSPNSPQLALLVARPTVSALLPAALALHDAPPLNQRRFDAASVVLGLMFAFAVRLNSVRRWLGAVLLQPHAAASSGCGEGVMGLWGGRAASSDTASASRKRVRRLVPLVVSAGGAWFICAEPADFLALRPISIYLGFAVLGAALTVMHGGGACDARVRRATQLLGRMFVLSIVIACGCALSGTKALDGIVAAQGALPSEWSGLQNPALIVGVPLYIAFAGAFGAATLALPGCPSDEAHSVTWVGRLLAEGVILERVATNIALTTLAVALFAGGWKSPAVMPSWLPYPARLLGALLFVAKAWGFAVLLELARRYDLARRLRMRVVTTACVVSVALTTLWLGLGPATTGPLSRQCGIASATAVCGILLALGARHVLLHHRFARRVRMSSRTSVLSGGRL